MVKEEWRDIEGYPNYRVSNLGRVKSLNYNHTDKERILKPETNKGYLRVVLCKNGKKKRFQVHRIVAMTFLPNPHNYPQVNHMDENPLNNCVENLEWCTAQYNSNYGTRIERVAAANKGKIISEETKRKMSAAHKGKKPSEETIKKRSKPVLQLDKITNEVIAEFPSATEVQKTLGVCHTAVSKCCLGKLKTYKGFKWNYKA